jgi:predicted RNA binding protein YcfA (HicA-like mRNA interferase family)
MPKKYREVRKALEEAGWAKARQAGSHEIWRHDESGRKVTVAGKNSDTVPVGTLSAIRRATGLDDLR